MVTVTVVTALVAAAAITPPHVAAQAAWSRFDPLLNPCHEQAEAPFAYACPPGFECFNYAPQLATCFNAAAGKHYVTSEVTAVSVSNSATTGSQSVTLLGIGFDQIWGNPSASARVGHTAAEATSWVSVSSLQVKATPAALVRVPQILVTLGSAGGINVMQWTVSRVMSHNGIDGAALSVSPTNGAHGGDSTLTIMGTSFQTSSNSPASRYSGGTGMSATEWVSDSALTVKTPSWCASANGPGCQPIGGVALVVSMPTQPPVATSMAAWTSDLPPPPVTVHWGTVLNPEGNTDGLAGIRYFATDGRFRFQASDPPEAGVLNLPYMQGADKLKNTNPGCVPIHFQEGGAHFTSTVNLRLWCGAHPGKPSPTVNGVSGGWTSLGNHKYDSTSSHPWYKIDLAPGTYAICSDNNEWVTGCAYQVLP